MGSFTSQKLQLFLGLAPGLVGLLVIKEPVVRVASLSQVAQGLEQLFRPNVFALLMAFVLFLALELDGDQVSLPWQSWQLLDGIHDVVGLHWDTDGFALGSCAPLPWNSTL